MKLLVMLIGLSAATLTLGTSRAQERVYSTSSWEFIFSGAEVNNNGIEGGSNLRFTIAVNLQNYLNIDLSDHFGLFTGLSVRNVGFIYDVPNSNVKKKYRTYNLGLPVGLKVGNLDKSFVYGGYELELPFTYKEKTFQDERKTDKFVVWFSNRHPTVYHTVMLGIQLPYSANIKFKYYLNNFLNQEFTSTDSNGMEVKQFDGLDVNVFYFSLSFNIFRNADPYYKEYWSDRN